jgi:hypothetical protein
MEDKTKAIIEDNLKLRMELEKQSKNLVDLYKKGCADESVSKMFEKLEKEDLNERIRSLTEENKLLLDAYQEIKVK